MEMHGRRTNYSLLSQAPDDHVHNQPPQQHKFAAGGVAPYYDTQSCEKNNWDLIDHRMIQPPQQNRSVAPPSSIGLQRQSSGSSFGESSISADYYPSSLSNPEAFGQGDWRLKAAAADGGGSSSSKSWAQQTEESYQLQLALALRLSSEATCADDPNFLDPVPDDTASRFSSSTASAESVSHRFWVNNSLSYFDRIPDGFYLINGIDQYAWTICNDPHENGRVPSMESLKAVDPAVVPSVEVIVIDRHGDPSLKEMQNRAHSLSSSCMTTKEVVEQLAKLVCNIMGGAAPTGEDELVTMWKECSDDLKDCLGSIVIPIGSLSVGLCRHRALLFKVLAEVIDLPCRIGKGCKFCTSSDASSCLVRFGLDREYLVDLIGNPGCLYEPDSMLNGPSSISISSPLHFPRFRQVEPAVDFRSLARQYFSDCQSLNLVFDDIPTGVDGDASEFTYAKQPNKSDRDRNCSVPSPSNQDDISLLPKELHPRAYEPADIMSSADMLRQMCSDARVVTANNLRSVEGGQLVPSKPGKEFAFDVEDLAIPWSDLVLKERIGAGSFGTVHRAEWHGSEVAVKILMEQEFHAERFKEFLREVAIMKTLRHPNIVLFMGAVMQPPNLSIVTEYLSRGSMYRILHQPGAREVLDERRRLCMAYDVAKGMNYLHKRNPPIVHRDLKSPNLLVDKQYRVKVCDFGLSRLKPNTFLSSKSAAGTPEWMAPEVLRDEPSNEKSDIYSFGVILWELTTLQQPWSKLNAAQVIAAVCFKGKRLEIPRSLNPQVAAIIEACWADEPWKRPSFATIMELLKPLTKSPPRPQSRHADM